MFFPGAPTASNDRRRRRFGFYVMRTTTTRRSRVRMLRPCCGETWLAQRVPGRGVLAKCQARWSRKHSWIRSHGEGALRIGQRASPVVCARRINRAGYWTVRPDGTQNDDDDDDDDDDDADDSTTLAPRRAVAVKLVATVVRMLCQKSTRLGGCVQCRYTIQKEC